MVVRDAVVLLGNTHPTSQQTVSAADFRWVKVPLIWRIARMDWSNNHELCNVAACLKNAKRQEKEG